MSVERRSASPGPSGGPAVDAESGGWAPLRMHAFRSLWLATLGSNIGTWMHELAASWAMTQLSSSRLDVALVPVASMLPVMVMGLPGGALADLFDRRRLLIGTQLWSFGAASGLGVLAWSDALTPGRLLVLVAALSIGTALQRPALQAIVPDLVPRRLLPAAVALNGASINLARAIGPALAGVLLSVSGAWAVFFTNAATFLCSLLVLWIWRGVRPESRQPPERVLAAMATGLRYVRHAPSMQTVLLRAAGFLIVAAGLWSLLPVWIAELGRGPRALGWAFSSLGFGAVVGTLALPSLRARWGANGLTMVATLVFGIGGLALSASSSVSLLEPPLLALVGMAWLVTMASLNTAAQSVLPAWVRARGLSIYLVVFAASMALGAAVWGALADATSVRVALTLASLGCLVNALLARRQPLPAENESTPIVPFLPAEHPVVVPTEPSREVQVCVRYRIAREHWGRFEDLMVREVGPWRLRTGAHFWGVYQDAAQPMCWVESFRLPSWQEHLRQHERSSAVDWDLRARAAAFHQGGTPPRVQHFLAPPWEPRGEADAAASEP